MIARLSPQPLRRAWLTTVPTYVPAKDLWLPLPLRTWNATTSFESVVDLTRKRDPRRMTPATHVKFTRALIDRAHRLLSERGLPHSVETSERGVYIALQPNPSDPRPLPRFIAASARQGVDMFYDPSYLLAFNVRAAADFRQHRLDLGHDDILKMDPRMYAMAHESVHLDTGRRLERGEAWWSYGDVMADTTKQRVLPGLGGGYGIYQCFDELRTNQRDLRQLVGELERLSAGPQPSNNIVARLVRRIFRKRTPLERTRATVAWKAEQMLQMGLRSIACLNQALGCLRRGSAPIGFAMRQGCVTGLMRIPHNGDPEGYRLTMHLTASQGPDDPRNQALLATQLAWALEGARSALAQARVILQALASVAPSDAAGSGEMCQRLREVMKHRPNEKAPGIRALSYERLLAIYNATAD